MLLYGCTLINETEKLVELPVVNEKKEKSFIKYYNFSIMVSKARKFSLYTASNINGKLFKRAERTSWKKDQRILEYQWGQELYSTPKSFFDKGHMTRREDVQWGETPGLAQLAANSSFFYTNAVPQHKDLNRKTWNRLENYILHKEAITKNKKICVFTGPVLSDNDLILGNPIKHRFS